MLAATAQLARVDRPPAQRREALWGSAKDFMLLTLLRYVAALHPAARCPASCILHTCAGNRCESALLCLCVYGIEPQACALVTAGARPFRLQLCVSYSRWHADCSYVAYSDGSSSSSGYCRYNFGSSEQAMTESQFQDGVDCLVRHTALHRLWDVTLPGVCTRCQLVVAVFAWAGRSGSSLRTT